MKGLMVRISVMLSVWPYSGGNSDSQWLAETHIIMLPEEADINLHSSSLLPQHG